jgi:hypothetical protein
MDHVVEFSGDFLIKLSCAVQALQEFMPDDPTIYQKDELAQLIESLDAETQFCIISKELLDGLYIARTERDQYKAKLAKRTAAIKAPPAAAA